MSFPVWDSRTDITHVLVTPQVRARFMRMEPGQAAALHSHDLGHEIFLILSGRARFTIDGQERELGPGQLCIALAHQSHQVRVVGEEPMVMYLSVTPHVQPTHTGRTTEGERLPLRFAPSSAYDVTADETTPVDAQIDACLAAADALAAAAAASAGELRARAAGLRQAMAAGDQAGAGALRQQLWAGVCASFERVYQLGEAWNALAPRAGSTS